MAGVMHTPAGRAGRLWLQRRLATARRAADLLDHKLRVLRAERQRLSLQEERTAATWQEAHREADTWVVRGVLLGGQRAIRLTADRADAHVEIAWEQSMGLTYPAGATVTGPASAPGAPPAGNAALVEARERCRLALDAAVQHAVVEAAARLVEAQERATRRRLRAVEHRWIPRLEESLARLLFKLEEDEHADGVRLRWAASLGADEEAEGPGGGRS